MDESTPDDDGLLLQKISQFIRDKIAGQPGLEPINSALETLNEHFGKNLPNSNAVDDIYFMNSPDAIIVTNGNGEVLRWNPVAHNLFGFAQQEALGKLWLQLIVQEKDRNKLSSVLDEISEAKSSGPSQDQYPIDLKTKSGEIVPCEINICPTYKGIIIFIRNITKRKKAEDQLKKLNENLEKIIANQTAALKESELKYKNAFELSPFPKWIMDMETLRFLEVNEAAVKHYGYSKEEFLSMTVADIRPNEEKAKFYEHIARDRSEGLSPPVWLHKKKDGTIIEVEVYGRKIDFGNGSFSRLIVAKDVTERNRAQKEIEELNDTLEQRVAQRTQQLKVTNEELESFSYSVSHDLRAPLRAINGYAQILKEDYEKKLDPEGLRLLGVIMSNAKRMGQLIDDLLNFSRIGKGLLHPEEINMESLFSDVALELESQFPTKPLVRIYPSGAAYADKKLLHQAIHNLLSNAFKYSSKKELPEVEIGQVGTNHGMAWYIKDNGAGFNMNYYDKLFGVFQRLHSNDEFEGTGVGLAIVKRIISRHGGLVWAESIPGEGAVFYFTLNSSDFF